MRPPPFFNRSKIRTFPVGLHAGPQALTKGEAARGKSKVRPVRRSKHVAVFSLKSGQEINNPRGPKEGGPEGTGKGKVQSTPVPKRGTKV